MTSELPDDYGPDLAWDAGEIEPEPRSPEMGLQEASWMDTKMPSSPSTGPA